MNCRYLSKPFKRAAFEHSRRIANDGVQTVYNKYSKKYAKKFHKNNLPVQDIHIFQTELLQKLQVEKSLSHSKTREYWLLRGPRLFCTIFIGVFANTCCIFLIQKDPDVCLTLLSGLIWLCLSAYMLYQRLPDAILSSLMRIGHDHYIQWKSTIFIEYLNP